MEEIETLEGLKEVLPEKLFEKAKEALKKSDLTEGQKKKAIKKIADLYVESKFEAGEAFGMIAAQSLSEPSTQMCTDYSEKVILKFDGKIKIATIGEFVDKIMMREGFKTVNGYEVYDVPGSTGLFVPSLNSKEKVEWKRVTAMCRHKSPGFLLEVKTDSGRSIKATDFHSFVIRKDNKIVPISGKELTVGDRIPSIKYLPENCIGNIEVKDYFDREGFEVVVKNGLLHRLSERAKPIPNEINLDFLFGWFIGAYLSEGGCTRSQVGISNIEEQFITRAKLFSERMLLDYKDKFYQGQFGDGRTLVINSTLLAKFIDLTCGVGSDNKRVPEFAYSAREEFASGLLRGYFDGDGNVHADRKLIRASSNSKELLDGISLLLARFGIFAYKIRANAQYGLLIPYKYAPIFLDKIGSDIPRKRAGLEKMALMAEDFWSVRSRDYTDMIGGFGDVLFRIAKKLKYPSRYINNFTNRQKVGRTALYRYIKIFEAISEERGVDISEDIKLLKVMVGSDVIWDRVSDIRKIKPTAENVYDLTVEDTHTFTTFSGIITHNTMRTYHMAGAMQIQVTLGLPRLVEIFDARRAPSTPAMTIYLKSSHNTREKAMEIAESITEVKLGNIAASSFVDLGNMQVEVVLDEKLMKRHKIKEGEMVEQLKEDFKTYTLHQRGNKLTIKPKEEATVKELQKLRSKFLDSHVHGVKSIENVVINQKDEGWVINTLGSNLKEILEMDGIDSTRTLTNNIHEVARVLGIEAARAAIVNEVLLTLKEQGLEDVDVRHVLLVADVMTAGGTIKAVGRYGIAGTKGSVLARANFEETMKHLTKASVYNEVDTLESVVENVMINQVVPAGTGMFDVVFKPPGKKKE